MQLKKILSKFNREKKLGIKVISKKRKDEVVNYLLYYKYNLSNLPEIEKQPTRTSNILKRFNTKAYNDEEQEQFLNKGYEVKNPLESKKEYYNTKTNKEERLTLLEHQKKFLRKFFLSNVSGSVVFHGVGTGKTITAVVASHYYLSLYPEGNVIIISPPALILNFVNGLKQYGLNVEDNRYSFKSFEQFSRNPTIKNPKTLIIVDEAHILRTEISFNEQVDLQGNKTINITSNKRGYAVLEACKKCDKCILLTATPFINKLYDIENLLSMIDKKQPLSQNTFYEMITNTSSRNDYFNYKISHYENPPTSEFFPEKIQEYVPLVMDDEELQLYMRFDRGDTSVVEEEGVDIIMNTDNDKALTSFYNGTRQYSDTLSNKKIDFIINRINKPQTTGQFIIYATFITNGLNKLKQALNTNKITFTTISGAESNDKKEDAKTKYNNADVQVLLISKAGTEGIDTINTEAVFIYEGSQWNEPLVEQAIARAVRYKSHYHLPKPQQKVFIYRLLVIKESDLDLINRINKNKIFNFGAINKNLVEQGKKLSQLKNEIEDKKDDSQYIINGKKVPDTFSQNMKNKIEFEKEKYRKLTPEQKQEYIEQIKYNRYETDNKINKLFKERPSVEARLTVLSLAKKEQIVEFINELDTSIQQLEDYETPYEVEVNELVLENLSDENILQVQKRYIEEQTQNIFKLVSSDGRLAKLLQRANERALKASEKLNTVKRYQAFYTPVNIIKKMFDFSKLLKGFNNDLKILEPTAGIGNIVVELIKLQKEYKIYMVEIEQSSRNVLQELAGAASDILTLYEQGNFLQFVNPIEYDMVIMNPPFHLQKINFTYLDKDYYDIDFVKRAYYMLRNGGELIALVRTENTQKEDFKKWLKNHDCIIHNFEYKDWESSKGNKLSEIKKINLSILVLYRDINNKYDTIKTQNIILNPDLSNENELLANNAQYYHTSINEYEYNQKIKVNNYIKNLFGENEAKYSEELDILKLDKRNVTYYDLRQFLKKWKYEEYEDDDDYLRKFAKNNGFTNIFRRDEY